ncbi:hypothetical protein RR48_00333 [Papilio machaon]|uniref:Uncharacterized protein n=1 Tax=Papilio machaon TaxID=76193 RepID=A0A0N1IQW0_PAPMA|nr:hypothetical protein RR48_00333 [Papilio machaon]
MDINNNQTNGRCRKWKDKKKKRIERDELRFGVIEKDPSVVEDYDPYRSWHGSQYGSRYPSSTIHSTRSVSDNSDHYAIVQSRPGSRHSGMHRSRH